MKMKIRRPFKEAYRYCGSGIDFETNLTVEGDLTFHTVMELYERGLNCFAGKTEYAVDLSSVDHADSAGIALLIEWQRQARALHCSLRFINLSEQIKEIIQVYGLLELFEE